MSHITTEHENVTRVPLNINSKDRNTITYLISSHVKSLILLSRDLSDKV